MNHDHDTTRQNNSLFDERIDATLRRLGSSTPTDGLESRVLARLRTEPAALRKTPRFFVITGPLFGACGAAFACALIVVASVGHSHHAARTIAPPIPVTGSGVGAASAAHLAGPHPVTPAPRGHGRSHTKAHAQKPGADAAPNDSQK
jgi:hypothetical protein